MNDHKEYYEQHLKSQKWRNFRAKKLVETNFSCEVCKSKKNLHLHHLTYENLGNEKDTDVMVLCQKCHEKAHNKQQYQDEYDEDYKYYLDYLIQTYIDIVKDGDENLTKKDYEYIKQFL